MGRRALVLAPLLAAALLTGCAGRADGPTDQEPRSTRHQPADGWHSVSYHGISVDVPDGATLTRAPDCGFGLPADGMLVVPLFDAGASSCPAQIGGRETAAPRPTTVLTVVLGTFGVDPAAFVTSGRHEDVVDVGARVTANGPTELVDGVLASIRITPQDHHGCADRIDPNVAPRNTDSPDGTLLPVATSRIVVCEYGDAETRGTDEPAGKFWLVASEELGDDATTTLDDLLRSAPPVDAADSEPGAFGPVLRLLVVGTDGNTRTLQALSNLMPQPVTDGKLTVGVDSSSYPVVPTPV